LRALGALSLLAQYHYLGYQQPVGEHLKYLVMAGDRPVACLAWGSAPGALGPRDRFIGWSAEARRRHIRLLAYNPRCLILPWVRVPHLASHVLGQMAAPLSRDWQQIYAHPNRLARNLIDPLRFRGTWVCSAPNSSESSTVLAERFHEHRGRGIGVRSRERLIELIGSTSECESSAPPVAASSALLRRAGCSWADDEANSGSSRRPPLRTSINAEMAPSSQENGVHSVQDAAHPVFVQAVDVFILAVRSGLKR
jgi:hypothetical protein